MKTIGFLISNKKYEKRRAIIPSDLKSIRNVNNLYLVFFCTWNRIIINETTPT